MRKNSTSVFTSDFYKCIYTTLTFFLKLTWSLLCFCCLKLFRSTEALKLLQLSVIEGSLMTQGETWLSVCTGAYSDTFNLSPCFQILLPASWQMLRFSLSFRQTTKPVVTEHWHLRNTEKHAPMKEMAVNTQSKASLSRAAPHVFFTKPFFFPFYVLT